MKKKRSLAPIVIPVLIVVGLLFFKIVKPSFDQNQTVNHYLTNLLIAVRERNKSFIDKLYNPYPPRPEYYDRVFKYPLLGWDIKKVGGQPFPMDTGTLDNYALVDLYYQLPPSMLKPQGKYQEIQHPLYHKCGLVTVKFAFDYDREQGRWWLVEPNLSTGENVIAPVEK